MLTGKQKRYLRAQAHHLKPIFQVGKIGVNDNMLVQIGEALEKRELIKVSLLQNCLDEKEDVAVTIEEGTGASVVQIIGSTIILYRESEDNKQIKLP
ncbi:RNA-binding protein [Terribacillus saccharophilus]|jgi:RNA-binding protein|uniref:RNA-binding protein n=1 Tax=Terribacillus saccharophilus TaxID=361277 RepID=A0A268HGA4_9BACI|nr:MULTISPECIES: ribosome assembly RNA-binding protein YhbY [Terribacillus]PAD36539.1 RNA-binding protein [Terribacillus saccharophilus]PAD97195.1 RNA-binding protein [Terribacillus saccharophilus]PAE00950.1 RNA-binding protein [Terribacillus saccharophilus]PAE08916.1 RNA-binding protein [Terribacillus saccharophilus]